MPINFNLKEFHKTKIFVETGLDRGFGVQRALDAGFEKIISVELRQESIQECTPKFKGQLKSGQVKFVLGSSADKLAEAIAGIDEPVTFWLDAHVGNKRIHPKFVKPTQKCPLYEELEAIKAHPVKNHTILIDDMDQIRGKTHAWTHEADETAVIKKIMEINPDYKIEYRKGVTDTGVLVARVPEKK